MKMEKGIIFVNGSKIQQLWGYGLSTLKNTDQVIGIKWVSDVNLTHF